jgi:competence protein ComEC
MGKVALASLSVVIAVAFAPHGAPRACALLALPFLSLALRRPAWRGAAAVALCGALAVLQVDDRLADRVPVALDGETLELLVSVASLPDATPRRTRFEAVVEAGPLAGRRLAAAWYSAAPPPRAGERWRLTAQVRRPRAHLNPGAADLEAAWFERGIDGLATVRAGRREAPAAPGVLAARAAIVGRIDAACGARTSACGVVGGLAVGRTAGIDDPTWRALRRTGTVHLVAISGLHVTLLGSVAALLAFALARRSAALVARVPAQVVAATVGLAVASGYALLAGASLPTRRTVLMLAVVAAAALLRRPAPARQVLAAALFAVLLVDPLAVLAPGFWLSFAGVALLVLCVAERGPLQGALAAQGVASVGLAPILLAAFGTVPLVAPLANLVAIPAFNLLLVPLALAGCVLTPLAPAAADACFRLCATLVDAGLPALVALGEATPELVRGPAGDAALALAALGTAWALAPRGVPGRALGATLWLPLLCAAPRLAPGEFDARVLDVGHGLAVVVTTRNHTLVYDTGPGGFDGDAAGWAVEPTLAALGRRPELIVVSHDDRDHAGGIARLAASYPAAGWRVGGGLEGPSCRAGQRWGWDGVEFELLHPPSAGAPGNDGSCVLRIAAPSGALLLPGDVEQDGEAALLAHGDALRADALVAPHHGSATSSSPAFVAAVAPRLVVHPAGWRNRWGFPRAAVVARYRAAGARQLVTGRDGAIDLRFRLDRPPQALRARDEGRVWREP